MELFGPITLFVSVYLATFLTTAYAGAAVGLPYNQWAALISAVIATAFTIRIVERGRWRLGIFVTARIAIGHLPQLHGEASSACRAFLAEMLAASPMYVNLGVAEPDGDLSCSAVPLQSSVNVSDRLYFRRAMETRRFAIGDYQIGRVTLIPSLNYGYPVLGDEGNVQAVVFAALHGGNRGISLMAILNLILAGILLALAYERFERLWFPIGIHFLWNILSGPILGYGVSGYVAQSTVFRTIGSGSVLITGGAFGIEASVWMGLVEVGGIFWMTRMLNVEW